MTPHKPADDELIGIATGFLTYLIDPTNSSARWARIEECTTKYSYHWKPSGFGAWQITFTGFKAANPFSEGVHERNGMALDPWHAVSAQVLIFIKGQKRGFVRNIYLDERDPIWDQPFTVWFESELHAAEQWVIEQARSVVEGQA